MGFEFDNDGFFSDEPDIREVINRYRSMLKNNTTLYFDSHEFIMLIDHYFEFDQYNEALQIADVGIRQHPASTELKLRKAEILLRLTLYDEALIILKELEEILYENSYIPYLKGIILSFQKKEPEAAKAFRKAILMTTETDEVVDLLLQIADHYEQKSDLITAQHYLLEAHKIMPNDSEIIIELAQNAEHFDVTESIYYYNLYLNQHPFHASVWFELGIVYSRAEKFEKALEAFDFAIAIQEKYLEAYFNKGNALANLGRYTEAIQAFEEYNQLLLDDADQVEPNVFLDSYCSIGECYERMGDIPRALEYYHKALSIDSEYADALYGIGIIHSIVNNLPESIKYINKAISIEPFNSEYYFSLGNVYVRMGKTENAIAAYRTAVDIEPDDYESWLNLANVFFEKKQLSKAIKVLEEAREHNNKNAIIEYRLAAYYCLKNKMQEGVVLLRKALIHDNSKYFEFLKVYPEAINNKEIKTLIDKFK